MPQRLLTTILALITLAPLPARADTVRSAYTRALEQERAVRDERGHATPARIRRVIAAYERLVARYPASAYSDNALWQAANLAAPAFDRSGGDGGRKTAARC